MSNSFPQELNDDVKCPECGDVMRRRGPYQGGTATERMFTAAVSSTSSDAPFIYPEQEVYECTNPICKKTLLRPRKK